MSIESSKKKKKRQKRNKEVDDQDEDISADDELTEEDEEEDKDSIWYFIKRLVTKEYRHDIENKTRSPNKSLISPGMVVNNYEKLNDSFLNFEMLDIKRYIDPLAWEKVIGLYGSKVIHSKCSVCKQLCLDRCVQCTDCKYWYNFDCIKLTNSKTIKRLLGTVKKIKQ